MAGPLPQVQCSVVSRTAPSPPCHASIYLYPLSRSPPDASAVCVPANVSIRSRSLRPHSVWSAHASPDVRTTSGAVRDGRACCVSYKQMSPLRCATLRYAVPAPGCCRIFPCNRFLSDAVQGRGLYCRCSHPGLLRCGFASFVRRPSGSSMYPMRCIPMMVISERRFRVMVGA